MLRKYGLTILVALGGMLVIPLAPAQAPVVDSASIDARLQRIERNLSSSSLLQLAQSLQALQREVRELRGEMELQSRDISKLRKRQRDLYLDLDKRLQALEIVAVNAPAVAGTPQPPPIPGAQQPPPVPGVQQPPPVPGTQQPPPPGTGTVATTPAPPPQPGAQAPAAPGTTSAAINAGVTPTAPPAPTQPAAPAPPPGNIDPAAEQQAYRDAFDLLKTGKFDPAANALQGFLKNYPNGRFADNAQYWLGEAYYVNRKYDPALKAFERLLIDFPDSPKRSHAMLKIGFIHDETGRKEPAKQVLTQLIQRYPQSTAAGLAKKRLSHLR